MSPRARKGGTQPGGLPAADVATIVWGLARLGAQAGPLLPAVLARARRPAVVAALDAPALAAVAWGCAALNASQPLLMAAVARRAADLAPSGAAGKCPHIPAPWGFWLGNKPLGWLDPPPERESPAVGPQCNAPY